MRRKNVKILEIEVSTAPKRQVLEEINKCLGKSQKSKVKSQKFAKKSLVIFTPNPEIINFAQKNPNFLRTVNTAQINIADGAGLCFAVKKIYGMQIERITGVDLMLDICKTAAKKGFVIGLIGGSKDVALETKECLIKKHPKLKIEVLRSPKVVIQDVNRKNIASNQSKPNILTLNPGNKQSRQTEMYFQALIKKIKNKKIDILFVALGFPKQEYFINLITYHLSLTAYNRPIVLMSVGGAFDYISGRVRRAPKWIRDKGFEWLFRLITQPQRLPRQLQGALFFLKVWRS